MARARAKVRRQLRGTGRPGTFGGRHHTSYRGEVQEILATDHLQTAEALLLGLMDAIEDEADELGCGIEGTYYLTLADLYAAHDRGAAQQALMERYQAACERYGVAGDEPSNEGERATTGVTVSAEPSCVPSVPA